MKVRMLGTLVGVEKLGKSSKKQGEGLFASVDVTHNLGIIRYLGASICEDGLKVGMKVYIGNQREEVRMEGVDIMVMDQKNIIAIVDDADEEPQKENIQA